MQSSEVSDLSSKGKRVLEAVYKNWVELYGSHRSETGGELNESLSALDEIFLPIPTLQQPKQPGTLRDGENFKNKMTEISEQNKCNTFLSTCSVKNTTNTQTCENICISSNDHTLNTLACDGSKTIANDTAHPLQCSDTERPVFSKFERNYFLNESNINNSKCDVSKSNESSHHAGTVSEAVNQKIGVRDKKNNEQSFNNQQENVKSFPLSGLQSTTSDTVEVFAMNEKQEFGSLAQNHTRLSSHNAIINNINTESEISEEGYSEQSADGNFVFKRPEILQNITQVKKRDDSGIEWFYDSHRAFDVKWAIKNECSVFSDLLQIDSSVQSCLFSNTSTGASEEKSNKILHYDVEKNVPETTDNNFDMSVVGTGAIRRLNKPNLCDFGTLKNELVTNTNYLSDAADHNLLTAEEHGNGFSSSEYSFASQYTPIKSNQIVQKPTVKTTLTEYHGENKTLDILPEPTRESILKHSNSKLKFSERKAKTPHNKRFFKSPLTSQNHIVSNSRYIVTENQDSPTKAGTCFHGIPVELHQDAQNFCKNESLSTNNQKKNLARQNKIFRIFKTKSNSCKNIDSSFFRSIPAQSKLKQEKLESFNFVAIPNKQENSDNIAENTQNTSRTVSSVACRTLTSSKPLASSVDTYSMSEVESEECDTLPSYKSKINRNKAFQKKVKLELSVKQKEKLLSFKQDISLQEAVGKTDEGNLCFSILTLELFDKLLHDLKQNSLQEISLAIVYTEGYCQLNKPIESYRSTMASCSPMGIMFGVMYTTCTIEHYYFDLCSASKARENRDFLFNLLNSKCRMICFEAQEMFALLIHEFQFHPRHVCVQWLMMDPMIGCWLLDPDHPVSSFKETVERLNVTISRDQELHLKYKSSAGNDLIHCCHLLQILSSVAEKLYESLSSQNLWELFTEVELKLTPLLAVMELRGIYVDKSEFQKMTTLLKEREKLLQDAAHKAAKKQFLLTSPKQLRTILYDELKLDQKHSIQVKETSVLKAKSTSESVLRLLEPVHALPGIVLEYRHIQKIKSTYVDGMLQQIKDNSAIFTTWEQTATATGRISSSGPNLQAVPKHPVLLSSHIAKGLGHPPLLLRSPYVSRPGFSFLAADFQHIEFRVFAHLAQDPILLDAFQQPEDIFLTLAKLWLKPGGASVSPEDREKTKRIVYSVMYGAGAGKLAEFLQVDSVQANGIINSFIGKFPALRSFFNSVMSVCRRKGELRTFSGRRRLFPAINSVNLSLKAQAERQAINFLIQGTAADICKAAMLCTEQQLGQRPDTEAYMLLQIHDELLWEVRDSDLEQVKWLVKTVMEDTSTLYSGTPKMTIPLPVNITTGKNWACMKAD